MDGTMKSLYHQLLIDRKFHRKDIDFKNSAWHLAYRKKNVKLDAFHSSIIDTIKRAPTYEKLGLNYFDLKRMSVAEFNEIRDIILEIDRAISDSNASATKRSNDVIRNLEKNLKG